MKRRKFEKGDLCKIIYIREHHEIGVVLDFLPAKYPNHDYNQYLVYSEGQCSWHSVYVLVRYIEE